MLSYVVIVATAHVYAAKSYRRARCARLQSLPRVRVSVSFFVTEHSEVKDNHRVPPKRNPMLAGVARSHLKCRRRRRTSYSYPRQDDNNGR